MKMNTEGSTAPAVRRIERGGIDRVLVHMLLTDIARCLHLVDVALRDGRHGGTPTAPAGILHDASATSAVKLVGFFIQRCARDWAHRALPERMAAFKELAWLRARLQGLLASQHRLQSGRSDAAAQRQPAQVMIDGADDATASIALVYQLCVGRTPAPSEVQIWRDNFSNGLTFERFLLDMHGSPEAQDRRKAQSLLSSWSDGEFIQLAYETVLGRGCSPREVEAWDRQLGAGWMDRATVLQSLLQDQAKSMNWSGSADPVPVQDGLSCQIMGTARTISLADWKSRAAQLAKDKVHQAARAASQTRFAIRSAARPLVSAIASLYRGGKFIERFMENITSQSCFAEHCELVIVDANSPEQESRVIERYMQRFKNIVYHRVNYRIGIYDAWNVGVQLARGLYCTNTNLDDLRRIDSLELQAATLDNLPFVDVVYQDFLYTFDPGLPVDEIARFGFVSELPVISPANMMYFNSPHNAPMWRKSLHDELGLFDTYYKSAGDYEFWMRCLAAGKVFFKLNEPHVVYYQNPEGLSTMPGSRGMEEGKHVLKKYGRRLVAEHVVLSRPEFITELGLDAGALSEPQRSRYQLAQRALRRASVLHKYPGAAGGGR